MPLPVTIKRKKFYITTLRLPFSHIFEYSIRRGPFIELSCPKRSWAAGTFVWACGFYKDFFIITYSNYKQYEHIITLDFNPTLESLPFSYTIFFCNSILLLSLFFSQFFKLYKNIRKFWKFFAPIKSWKVFFKLFLGFKTYNEKYQFFFLNVFGWIYFPDKITETNRT